MKHNGETNAAFREVRSDIQITSISLSDFADLATRSDCYKCQLDFVPANTPMTYISQSGTKDVRTYGLAMKKDNVQLRDMLMYNEADLKTIVDNGIEALRTKEQREERKEIQAEATREVVGVDDLHPLPYDEDRGEGEIKGMGQPKIAGLEGIEFDTGNS